MLSCLGESNTVSAASILFPWMQTVYLIFQRFVLTLWIINVPWKPVHHKSIPLSYPQIHFCNNPPLLPQVRHTKQPGKYIHTCMHITIPDTEIVLMWRKVGSEGFYAVWLVLMYFQEFKGSAYRERIPVGFTHWLVSDGKDSHFMLICYAGMTSEIVYMTSNMNTFYKF